MNKLILRFFPLCFLLLPVWAHAQLLDRIDVNQVSGGVEVSIRFNATVQYVRHAPEEEGKFLRVFIRVTDGNFLAIEQGQQVIRSPKSDLIPGMIVSYPETRNGMLITFAKSTRFSVAAGEDGRTLRLLLPLPPGIKALPVVAQKESKPAIVTAEKSAITPAEERIAASSPDAPEKQAVVTPLTPQQVEVQASAFLAEARSAFERKDYPQAINRLYRVLGLPRNEQTEGAQGLIGQVRDAAGEFRKARAEYELYLKLYPKGPQAAAITARLAVLPAQDQVKRVAKPVRPSDEPAEWQVFGSLSSYQYSGKSSNDGGPMVKDQSTLISSVNLNARLRDGATDTRFVYRDTHNRNQLSPSRSYDRVYSAYAERTDRDVGYFVRAGRQNPNGSGVMERFDGVTGSYNLNEDWRVGAVSGTAVEFTALYKKTFYGGNVEYLAQAGRPGINSYYIEQKVDNYLSRRAVGAEVRYFDGSLNTYGMVDYDLLYGAVNMLLLQGNIMDSYGNSYYAMADKRRSPSLGLTSGMMLLGQPTVADVVKLAGIDEARKFIEKGTPTSNMYSAGVTHPFTDNWQLGVDYRKSSITGSNAVIPLSQVCDINTVNEANGTCQASNGTTVFLSSMCTTWSLSDNTCAASQMASGVTNSYTFQAIGSNLFVPNGVGVANLSFTEGPTYKGQSTAFSYIFPFKENWRLESNLRFYSQKDDSGATQERNSPSIKLAYQWRSKMYLEGEMGRDNSKSVAADSTVSTSRRDYLYMGARWDFR